MGCAPDCYQKGKGCTLSSDGRCIILYAKEGAPKVTINNFQEELHKVVKERYGKLQSGIIRKR